MFPSRDFKSLASAYSAIPAYVIYFTFRVCWRKKLWSYNFYCNITPSLRAFPYCSNLRHFSARINIVRKRGSRHSHRISIVLSLCHCALCARRGQQHGAVACTFHQARRSMARRRCGSKSVFEQFCESRCTNTSNGSTQLFAHLCTFFRFQMRVAYSSTDLSAAKNPAFAMLTRDIRFHVSLSR